VVVHNSNPGYARGRNRRISVQGQPGLKSQTLSEKQTKRKRTGAWLKRGPELKAQYQTHVHTHTHTQTLHLLLESHNK
jgi:hypothetical protein